MKMYDYQGTCNYNELHHGFALTNFDDLVYGWRDSTPGKKSAFNLEMSHVFEQFCI